jgi:hypothetical protein
VRSVRLEAGSRAAAVAPVACCCGACGLRSARAGSLTLPVKKKPRAPRSPQIPFGWSFLSIAKVPMTWLQGDVWQTEVMLPAGQRIEYKYVILEDQVGGPCVRCVCVCICVCVFV